MGARPQIVFCPSRQRRITAILEASTDFGLVEVPFPLLTSAKVSRSTKELDAFVIHVLNTLPDLSLALLVEPPDELRRLP